MIRKIDNIGISVKDVQRSKEFYSDTLGLKLARPYKEGDTDLLVQVGDLHLYIFQTVNTDTRPVNRTANYTQNDIGIDHLSLEVEDVDHFYQQLGAKGVGFLGEPAENWGLRYVGLMDPDGNIIYFVKRVG